MKRLVLPVMVAMALICGCKEKGPAEEAGRELDRAGENAKDSLEKAADKTGDAVKDAGDKIKDATK